MTPARRSIWLTSAGRFATLSPRAAATVAVLALLLLLSGWAVPAAHDAPPRAGAQTDFGLYAAIVDGVHAGGNYYTVAAQALRAGGYPLKPFVTFRLPTLAVVQAALPQLVMLALLAAAATGVVLTWRRRIVETVAPGVPRGVAYFLLAGGIIAFVQPGMVGFHEVWAGLLVAWSLGLRRADRWIEAVALATSAMLIRETAAVYSLVMLAAALTGGHRREAIGWGAGLLVFVAILSLHARAAAIAVGPLDPVSPGWSGLHGPGLFALGMAKSTVLTLAPWWIGAPVALLALIGWCAAPGALGVRAALTFGGYTAMVAVFARSDNFYWVLVVAPVFLVGLVFLPDALRDLATGLLDRRRVRVQRIVR